MPSRTAPNWPIVSFMPLGQFQFIPAQSWESTVGIDSYAIVQPTTPTSGSGLPQALFVLLFLNAPITVLGTYTKLSDATNAAQLHFNGLAT